MKDKEMAELREWAVKKAAMYDMKYAKCNDAMAWVNAQRYSLIVELCDSEVRKHDKQRDNSRVQ